MARSGRSEAGARRLDDDGAKALLLACLQTRHRPDDVAAAAANLSDKGWTRLLALAAEQRVRPLLRAALARQGGAIVPAAVRLSIICLVGGQAVLQHGLGLDTTLSVVIEFIGGLVFIALLVRSVRR